MKPTPDTCIVHAGRICFGLGIAGLGIQHFVIANFVGVAIPFRVSAAGLPDALGLLLLMAGVGVCLGRAGRPVGLLPGAVFFSSPISRTPTPSGGRFRRELPPGRSCTSALSPSRPWYLPAAPGWSPPSTR